MSNVIVDYRSEPLNKALALENSQANAWADFGATSTAPSGDGVYDAGMEGVMSAGRLYLLPYCNGPVGSQFAFRVYGWRPIDRPKPLGLNQNQTQQPVWIPTFLGEFSCTAADRPGRPGGVYPLTGEERLCDTISLTQGNVGVNGLINSTGPGTDLIAFALLDLAGCKKFQFDFQSNDPAPASMNLLWARA